MPGRKVRHNTTVDEGLG